MPRKVPELPRATVWVDERGRITIPQYLREAAGIPEGGWIEIEAYPDLDECRYLSIIKA